MSNYWWKLRKKFKKATKKFCIQISSKFYCNSATEAQGFVRAAVLAQIRAFKGKLATPWAAIDTVVLVMVYVCNVYPPFKISCRVVRPSGTDLFLRKCYFWVLHGKHRIPCIKYQVWRLYNGDLSLLYLSSTCWERRIHYASCVYSLLLERVTQSATPVCVVLR